VYHRLFEDDKQQTNTQHGVSLSRLLALPNNQRFERVELRAKAVLTIILSRAED